MIKAGIFGMGYAGEILHNCLSGRDDVKVVHAFSGEEIRAMERVPDDMDVAFSVLPVEPTMVVVQKLLMRRVRVIDLSGAHRLKNPALYTKFHGVKHQYPSTLKMAVYGLPEKNRQAIKNAKLIAVPGCYAKAICLGLLPILGVHTMESNIEINVHATSGYTGAGKEHIKKHGPPKEVTPYKPGRVHYHVAEIEQEFGLPKNLFFYPSAAPWPRGIEVLIKISTNPCVNLLRLYDLFYREDEYIRVKNEDISIKQVINTNYCCIYPKFEDKTITIKVVIDNLIMGAAGQAIHNMNIMFGLKEDLILTS